MHSPATLCNVLLAAAFACPFVVALPVPQTKDGSLSLRIRQNILTPLLDITNLDLGDISPIEDGFLELDSDDGSGNENGSSSVSNANGYLGSIGSGQSAAEQGEGVEGSSAACGKSWKLLEMSITHCCMY